ncbi:hypothetical protein NQ176_g260 [Zarea fungicola]|uniref:Uncharacterized protein n=1 Tax=Zarea fungicola TaxID=93591 RepID=A0ACC1NYR3_9HYPO|nr:hypothetical protein NQ176_g260 [Lecanicillium fungicola]
MHIVNSFECGKRVNGTFQIYVKVVVLHNGQYHVGKWNDRKQLPHDFSQLEDVQTIRTENRSPKLRPHWTTATPVDDIWLKTPSIDEWLDNDHETRMAHEIEMCELIRQNQHPNLAVYCGCSESNGLATGLLFKKYKTTLLEQVNPQRLSKKDFIARGRPLVRQDMKAWFPMLRAAVQHLHSLGLVHNDITPANIMLDENDIPIIIDFGGLCRLGDSLRNTKRTMGWHDEAVTHATASSDTFALTEIEAWLFGSLQDLKFI